jgi:hypothetical protein
MWYIQSLGKEHLMNYSAGFLTTVGFLMTLGGVGGIEHSMDTASMIQSMAVALVGLAVAGCGVLAIQVQQNS